MHTFISEKQPTSFLHRKEKTYRNRHTEMERKRVPAHKSVRGREGRTEGGREGGMKGGRETGRGRGNELISRLKADKPLQ